MTVWRPPSRIRVKALGLHWRDGRLLAAEVPDDAGRVKGVRPLGGSVEFGETARAAVIREFREELGIDVSVVGEPVHVENIYVHEGAVGHEYLVLFEVAFPKGAFDGQDDIVFYEDDGAAGVARWFALDDLDREGGPELYPKGLKARLLETKA
ncbi:NUDIX hydrolase [Methylopila musalis]|uniref:NUDIX hydrolase n=1 Tax=Methylopila musalis TaxID=1134781 RepID=A0ABW3Z624_9HYPH